MELSMLIQRNDIKESGCLYIDSEVIQHSLWRYKWLEKMSFIGFLILYNIKALKLY